MRVNPEVAQLKLHEAQQQRCHRCAPLWLYSIIGSLSSTKPDLVDLNYLITTTVSLSNENLTCGPGLDKITNESRKFDGSAAMPICALPNGRPSASTKILVVKYVYKLSTYMYSQLI